MSKAKKASKSTYQLRKPLKHPFSHERYWFALDKTYGNRINEKKNEELLDCVT